MQTVEFVRPPSYVESVTLERDLASGLRSASVLVAWGLVLGRSVAGDGVSITATMGIPT